MRVLVDTTGLLVIVIGTVFSRNLNFFFSILNEYI